MIRTPNVRDGRFVFEDLTYTDESSYEIWTARGKPRIGDVVITREAPFGEACLIPLDMGKACLGQRMMMYQVDSTLLDNHYLVYAIYSERVQKRLLELAGGSTVGHIRVGDIRTLSIPHPKDVEEQKLIAGVLTEADEVLLDLRTTLDKYRSLKIALMQDLLTGKMSVSPLLKSATTE